MIATDNERYDDIASLGVVVTICPNTVVNVDLAIDGCGCPAIAGDADRRARTVGRSDVIARAHRHVRHQALRQNTRIEIGVRTEEQGCEVVRAIALSI